MHGLTRVRQFTISEGHLIVRPDQMVKEFKDCIALAQYCLQVLGVEEDVHVSDHAFPRNPHYGTEWMFHRNEEADHGSCAVLLCIHNTGTDMS